MKKFFMLLLALTVGMAYIPGCGGDAKKDEKKTEKKEDKKEDKKDEKKEEKKE